MTEDAHDEASPDHRRSVRPGIAALHLFTLAGFAIAQPIFDVASRNPTYLVAHGLGRWTVTWFTLGMILVPPAAALAVVMVLGAISTGLARVVLALAIGALFSLTVCPPLLRSRPGVLPVVVYAAVAGAGAVAYLRVRGVSRYLTWLAPAPLLFAFGFVVAGPASAFFRSAPDVRADHGERDYPSVVHLILDEFSLGSLLTPDGEIDERRFPNFARLAGASTWYPNATTNSNATRHAVPAALTGRFPKSGHRIPPTASVYPENLFSLLARTHHLSSGETITAICPVERCHRSPVPASAVKHLLADTSLVYLHGALPPIVKERLPSLPERQWAGFFADPLTVHERVGEVPAFARPLARRVLETLADRDTEPYSPEVQRFNTFVGSIRASSHPALWFHHALVPHQPWHLTAEGIPYDEQRVEGFIDARWTTQAFADQTLQRYLLQLKATDRLIGKLVSRIRSEGLWDDTMIVVHADHGVAFAEGRYYRALEGLEGENARIPLFVKYPRQREGTVDDRNVELIDLVPTIADAVDVRLRWEVDGRSLLRPGERRYKRLWSGNEPARPLEPYREMEETKTPAHVRRLFGAFRERDDLNAWGPHRDLVGRRPGRVRSGRSPIVHPQRAERYRSVDVEGPFLPTRVVGTVEGETDHRWIAVALNGRIAGIGHLSGSGTLRHFAVMMSPAYMREGTNDLAFHLVGDDGELVRLPET